MRSAIRVRALSKLYYVHERDAGLAASLRSLVKRRTKVVAAVDGIDFDVAAGEVTLVVLIPATFFLIVAFEPRAELKAWSLALLIPAMVLAFGLRFVTGWTLALAAFWTTRVAAVNQLYFVVFMFTSGQMMPLSLLPEWLVAVTWLTPFRWMLAFPVELAIGRLTVRDALIELGMQAFWSIAVLALLDRIWRAAVRQYTAVGA